MKTTKSKTPIKSNVNVLNYSNNPKDKLDNLYTFTHNENELIITVIKWDTEGSYSNAYPFNKFRWLDWDKIHKLGIDSIIIDIKCRHRTGELVQY